MATHSLALARRLRFQHLELLREVAERGTLGEAAAALHLSKPAVSKALKEIESGFGQPLFERSARGMRPTALGARVVRHARLLLHEFRHMVDDVGDGERKVSGRVRVGMSPYVNLTLAPGLITRLKRLQPQEAAAIQVSDGWLAGLIERLLGGELDVVLALYAPQAVAGMDLSRLVIEPLREEPMIPVASPALAVAPPASGRWRELLAWPWILPPPATHLRRTVDERFAAEGARPPLPVIESPVLAANAGLAAAGLGLTVVPASAAAPGIAAGRLRALDTLAPLPPTHLVLMYRRVAALYLPWIEVFRAAALEVA
ncbi:LysR family transcriptional regulator [Verticiella sediminum]|uniref:LysR family transcriptional regulator n=1 Tax=Verticiella sediminum TaxID=1247510 RepID=A0A556A7K9_9BURK|nr:LysR substrate-binding domain-containing protein [Verticiella sediminum]TSH88872.1 LysR family transcriptional regulator [Verticiella sediminum]